MEKRYLSGMITAEKKNDPTHLLALKEKSLLAAAQQRAITAEEEVAALRQQHIALRDFCEKEKEQNAAFQQKQNHLEQTILEKEKQISDLQKQLEESQRRIKASQFEKTAAASPPVKDLAGMQALKEENSLLSQSLNDSQQHAKQLERVIQFLRKKGEESHLEAKQLREEFQELQIKLGTFNQQNEFLKERDHQLQLLKQEIEGLKIAKKSLEDSLDSASKTIEEKGQHFKIAQQHLAKKMKECALLTEKGETQKNQILELQQAQTNLQNEMKAEQLKFEKQLQQEKIAQEKFQETIKLIEAQSQIWEEKYLQLHNRWQEIEQNNLYLKSLEEKYKQAQMMLTNITMLFDKPQKKEEDQPIRQELEPQKNEIVSREEQTLSLFEKPKSSKFKQSLFD